jgi:hypothetical protein
MTRETIYAALFAKWRNLPGVVTLSRRLKHWSDAPVNEQPAVFQVQRHENPSTVRGMPTKWTLAADLYVYVNTGNDTDEAPAPVLNAILDAIEAAIAPDITDGFQTLGNLVSHCWISGPIETDEGTLGAQAVAIVPIEILVA